ncbi:uncharacterized protein N7482_008635 [Penicillium canariense]|uniref:Peptide N-acetyl-beta-D-glucosaminyl asparaginase amidase A N-terminal domain-containing protein n=1 Tax=Penicillium canariense TaxID=189055 RepID=A0A9W9HWD4_9EURO|nr:uncharacterized protein N7482_008635 [Penicillium canariense]KAJ5157535.1 hypothetical protein N7482_008635 [Penicillium canariense]
MAFFGSSLASRSSLFLRLTYLDALKTLAPVEVQFAALPILLLLLWTLASIVLVLWSRSRQPGNSTPSPTVANSTGIVKVSVSTKVIGLSSGRIRSEQHRLVERRDSRLGVNLAVTMILLIPCVLLLLGHVRLICAIHDGYHAAERSILQSSDSTDLLDVFQVYQPVTFAPQGDNGCDLDLLLMEHVFGASYGEPFVGTYEPPSCKFDTVQINMTVTSRGRQYDRLALMYLGDAEVFRTSTAEPTSTGIVWTYIKEMSQYNALWQQQQKLIFDLGNIITDVYTGSFNVTLTAHFSYTKNARTADVILPISAKQSASNSSSAFTVPSDNTTVSYTIPAAASRAVVAISACGQSQEEFWWSNVFSEDTEDFTDTVGELYGYSPFREIQLYIDGILAGVVWPFPIIFTGGVAPGFWRPIVGIDAFDLRQPEIDISPFLPLLQDGREHSFEIRVTGLNITADGTATLAGTVGSYWIITGNIFLYTDDETSSKDLISHKSTFPLVDAPAPKFTVTRHLVPSKIGGNDTLSYSVTAERTFIVSSAKYSWSQKLSFSNYGSLNQQGYSQVNKQLTSGKVAITELGDKPTSSETTFSYPLLVNATYGITSNSLTIDAWMKRGLEIDSSGGPGISTYTLVSGPSQLHTTQSGKAQYKSVTGASSISWGNTADEFHGTANGEAYSRSVRAVNGSVVYDTQPGTKAVSVHDMTALGRGSVRSMLGRGPGNPASS